MAPQRQIPDQLSSFIRRLTLSQKLTIAAVAVGAIAGMIALVTVVNRPTYAPLFTNLNEQDAAKIVDKLKEKSVPYTLEDGGKSILVPKQQIYDMRLALAGEGLPQSSIIGYELFDRTNLGVSDFVQKINYRRALEGELARTILQIDEVEAARVHLVVPEKALFKEDEKPATASVVLKLKSGRPLRSEAVKGISHLVASSIEGLDAADVTILDSRGLLLSDAKTDGIAAATATQYDLQQKVETYLARKAQSMLESVVGTGNALVQVTAELDFRQVERTLEQYDPENTAVRSEQISEQKGPRSDSSSSSSSSNSTVTNYEVNKTVEHIVDNLGNVKRISVAAVVNGVPKTVERDGQKVTEMNPRPQEEMDKLTDLVKKCVGFNTVRNDEVSVTNLAFGSGGGNEQDFVYKQGPGIDWTGWLTKGLLVAAMLGAIVIVRSLLNRMRVRLGDIRVTTEETGLQAATAALRANRETAAELQSAKQEEASEAAMLRTKRRERIASYITQNPNETSRLLKVWLAEE